MPDFHYETKASRNLVDAIDLAISTPECDSRKWSKAIGKLCDQAYAAPDKIDRDCSPVDMSVSEVRKSLKTIRK